MGSLVLIKNLIISLIYKKLKNKVLLVPIEKLSYLRIHPLSLSLALSRSLSLSLALSRSLSLSLALSLSRHHDVLVSSDHQRGGCLPA